MTDLEKRLKAGPESVAALLRAARRPLSLSDPMFWHGLAEAAGHRANSAFGSGDPELGLSWARSSVGIYDCLALDVTEWNSFDLSSMHLRASAIRSCGALNGDPVRDPSVIIAWVRAALTYPLNEAVARSADLRVALAKAEQPLVAEARALRQLKNRLGVLLGLESLSELAPDLQPWLSVRERLL